jgi:hypothetical protein
MIIFIGCGLYFAIYIYTCIYVLYPGVIATEDDTHLAVTLPPDKSGQGYTVTWNGRTYRPGDTMHVTLNSLQTFQVQSKGDLSGALIHANHPVAVVTGTSGSPDAHLTSTSGHVGQAIPPITAWGTSFVSQPRPTASSGSQTDILRIISKSHNTQHRACISGKHSM